MKKILVVVDYQNDFVNGSLGFKKAESLEDKIYKKVTEYLNEGNKVIFTYDTHYDNYMETREGVNLPIKHCIENTQGHELYGKIAEFKNTADTIHIKKESFGVAPEDIIDIYNQTGDVDIIELVGLVSNICVISNVCTFQSKYVNSQIIVNKNLCASNDEEIHEKVIDIMRGLQVKVTE